VTAPVGRVKSASAGYRPPGRAPGADLASAIRVLALAQVALAIAIWRQKG